MLKRPSWFLTFVLTMFAFLVGSLLTLETRMPGRLYTEARYELRETLDLQKSWYNLPGSEQAIGRQEVFCPPPSEAVVLVTGGQSNAANVVPAPHEAENDVAVWFDGRCFPADDPILGATAKRGSLWSLLGDRLAAELGRPVLLINGAVGGTQFGDWLDDRSGYYKALNNRVSSARDAGYRPDLVLWHQGETDAAAEHDMTELKSEIDRLVDRILKDIPEGPLYLFQASRCIGSYRVDGVPEVIAVQQEVAANRSRVVAGMNTDELGRNFRWDTCHLNSLGREAIVNRVMPKLLTLLKSEHAG